MAIGLACAAGSWSLYHLAHLRPQSDWDAVYLASQAMAQHRAPYQAAHDAGLGYELIYPLTAPTLLLPATFFPLDVARTLWIGVGAGLLAWALMGRGWWGLLAFLSTSTVNALGVAQWGPLLLSAATTPLAGFVLAAKPTVGTALWVSRPNRSALLGGAALTALSLALAPDWPRQWLALTTTADWIRAPMMRPGGALLLLAWLRWRDPDARLLGALAMIPHTLAPSETLALFLIPKTAREMGVLVVCSQVAFACTMLRSWDPNLSLRADLQWPGWLVLLYLPALVMVLRRPDGERAPSLV